MDANLLVEVMRWIAALALVVVWLYFVADNAYTFSRHYADSADGRPYSPFLGGLAGAVAVLVVPLGTIDERYPFALIPPILDLGSVYYLMLFLLPPRH